MEKFSDLTKRKNCFIYLGKEMPNEFAEVCRLDGFAEKILNRKDPSFRFYNCFNEFLSRNSNNLPRSVYELAQRYSSKYPTHLIELFNKSEEDYKKDHYEDYLEFFENKDLNDKKIIFNCADFGGRSVFELQQDVIAGNLFEDLLVDNSLGGFHPNPQATGRETLKISTNCDLIYETPPTFKEYISVPLEVKTKWKWKLEDNMTVDMRGNAKKVFDAEGMVLTIYMYLNKAVLVDTKGQNVISLKEEYGKTYDKIHVSKDQFFDFKFWDEADMRKLLNTIYLTYKKRRVQ